MHKEGLFAVVAVVTAWLPIRIWLVPPSFQRNQAKRLAREQFYSLRLHETADATGILVFVSIAEHYVEILADGGIDAKVSAGVWKQIVADLTAEIRAGKTGDGFVAALAACGGFLAQHFPPSPGDRNELPDVLIEL